MTYRTIWIIFVGDNPGTIPVQFGQIPISGSREEVVWTFPYIIQCKIVTPRRGQFWPQGHNLNNFGRGPLDDAIYIPNMKALNLVVSDKKIFENCISKTYFLTPWPTYATNWNNLNNFGRGPPRDHSCEVWSKSNERFQRRRCLSKRVYARSTTDERQRRTTDKDWSQ